MQWNNLPRLCNELVSFDLPHGNQPGRFFFHVGEGGFNPFLTNESPSWICKWRFIFQLGPRAHRRNWSQSAVCLIISLHKPCQNSLGKPISDPVQVCLGNACCIITIHLFIYYLCYRFFYKKIFFSLCCHKAKAGPQRFQPLNMISKMPPGRNAVWMRYWSSYNFVLFRFLQPLLQHWGLQEALKLQFNYSPILRGWQ